MKTLKTILFLVLSAVCFFVIFTSCQKEESENMNGTVIFKFQAKESNDLKAAALISGIIITIDRGNETVINRQKLELIQINGNYLSTGISLPVGNYELREFMVTDVENNVIYAAPLLTSKLSQVVEQALPIYFYVDGTSEIIVTPEVISMNKYYADDFGYMSFSLDTVEAVRFITTIYAGKTGANGFEGLDSCNLFIKSPSGKTYQYLLKNSSNQVYVKGEPGEFIFITSRSGYSSRVDTFSNDELKQYSKAPFHTVLSSIENDLIWFRSVSHKPYFGPKITTYYDTEFLVDWGNGITEKVRTTDQFYDFSKNDSFEGQRILQISGDMKSIRGIVTPFEFYFNDQPFSGLNLRKATEMESVHLGWISTDNFSLADMHSLKSVTYEFCYSTPLDVTNCYNLEEIILGGLSFATLDIRTNCRLTFLRTNGDPVTFGENPVLSDVDVYFKSDHANSLLISLLSSVEKHPRTGKLRFSPIGGGTENVLNDDGREAVRKLRDDYHWNIDFSLTTRPF